MFSPSFSFRLQSFSLNLFLKNLEIFEGVKESVPIRFEVLNLDLYECFGDRKTGLAQDDELTVAFPVSLADEILDGLHGTEKTAAYPTPMDIGFPQMPDYTLTDWSVAFRKSMTRRNP